MEINKYYNGNHAHWTKPGHDKMAEIALHTMQELHLELDGKDVLEIGVGGGYLGKLIVKNYAPRSLTGVEPDTTCNDFPGKMIHRLFGDDDLLPDFSFDAIISCHVLEHSFSPEIFITHAYNCLKKDGVFFALTPNTQSFGRWWYGAQWRNYGFMHSSLLGKSVARDLLERAGFKDIKIVTWGYKCNSRPGINRLIKLLGIGDVMGMIGIKKNHDRKDMPAMKLWQERSGGQAVLP